MANEIHGKNGQVYANPLVIHAGQDTWNEQVVAGVALSTTTGPTSEIALSARATTTTVGAATVLMSEAITKNLTSYAAVAYWMRSSLTTISGDLQLLLDDTANCASPLESLNIPALTANTYRMCFNRFATPASLGSIISVGLKQVNDLADGTFDISQVYAMQEVAGMNAWNLSYVADTSEVTNFNDAGVKRYIVGGSSWSGSFSGFKTGVPLSLGSSVYIVLGESTTGTQSWMGNAIITNVTANVTVNGAITYAYNFQGTGPLQVATT